MTRPVDYNSCRRLVFCVISFLFKRSKFLEFARDIHKN